MIQYIKNAWLKHKIDNARLLENDSNRGDLFFIISFQNKHPEYSVAKIEMLVEEYKDFMFLAATSDEECTPSKEVDEIWHHHILHTKDYFDHWCGNVIGKVIHHNPEMPNDTKDYQRQFEKTNKKLAEVVKPKKVKYTQKQETVKHNNSILTNNNSGNDLLDVMVIHSAFDDNTPCNDHSHSSESSHSSCSSSSSSCSSSSCSSSSCSSSSCGGGGGD